MNEQSTKLWGTAGRVQEIIGLDATAKLLLAYLKTRRDGRRYCRVAVPKEAKISSDGRLSMIIGYENALRLSQEFGGDTIELPRSRHVLLVKRNLLIVEMSKLFRPEEISEMMTMTSRTVRNIQNTYSNKGDGHDHRTSKA